MESEFLDRLPGTLSQFPTDKNDQQNHRKRHREREPVERLVTKPRRRRHSHLGRLNRVCFLDSNGRHILGRLFDRKRGQPVLNLSRDLVANIAYPLQLLLVLSGNL